MKKIISIFCILPFSSSLYADGDFTNLYSFAESIRTIGLKLPDGHPMPNGEFHLNTMQSDQVKALAGLDENIRAYSDTLVKSKGDCDKQPLTASEHELITQIKLRTFEFGATVISRTGEFEQNALGRFTSDDYINYLGQIYIKGNTKALNIYNFSNLESKFKELNPNVDLSTLNLSQKENILNSFAESYLEEKLPNGLIMKEMAFQNMIQNSSQWKTTLEEAKDKLSSEQKIQLVSKLGNYFGNYYNYNRRDQGAFAKGYIDIVGLLDSVKNQKPGGVCRDIALAQVQMLKELGFNDNYIIGYKSLTGFHTTVISKDPNTGKIVKFNYGESYEMKENSGAKALVQDNSLPEHGLDYHIYDSNGRPVTKVPSDLGQILKETLNDKVDRDFNQKNYRLAKVGFKSSDISGTLFTGVTSGGETITGVALNKDWSGSNSKLGFGASLSKVKGNTSTVHIDQTNLFLMAHAQLNTNEVPLGKVSVSGFAGGTATLLISKNRESSLASNRTVKSNRELEPSADFHAGVQGQYQSGKAAVDSKVYATFYPDFRNLPSLSKFGPVINSVVADTSLKQSFGQSAALLDTAFVLKNYGSFIVISGQYSDREGNQYKVEFSKPMSNIPPFLPGGQRLINFSAEKGASSSSSITYLLEYEINRENGKKTLKGRGEVKF